jgi:hypothetical protein
VPLAVRRRYLIVVLRPVPRPLPAATRRCRIRKKTLDRRKEEPSKYYQLHLHRGPLPAATRRCRSRRRTLESACSLGDALSSNPQRTSLVGFSPITRPKKGDFTTMPRQKTRALPVRFRYK